MIPYNFLKNLTIPDIFIPDTTKNGMNQKTTKTMESNGLKNTDDIPPLHSPNSSKTKRNEARRKRQRAKKLQQQSSLYDDILSSSDEETYAADERKSKRRKSNEKSRTTKQGVESENNTIKKSKTVAAKRTPGDKSKAKKSTTPKHAELTQPETETVKNQKATTKSKTTNEKTKKTVKNEAQSTSSSIDKKTAGAVPTDVNEFISQLVTKVEQEPQLLKDNELAQRKMRNIKNSRK